MNSITYTMYEYTNVEKPYPGKLHQAHWDVIDQGQGVTVDPGKSLRTSSGEVALKSEFMRSVGELNPWATREQLEYCYDRILLHGTRHPAADKNQT